MSMPRRDMNGEAGKEGLVHLHACTLADYTAAGTTTPAVGDIVTPSSTGNWYAKRAADNATKRLGEITKIEKAPTGSELGYFVVRWFDCERVLSFTADDLSAVTLGNSLIKDGDTTVGDNFDAGATTGSIIAVSREATSGAGEAYGMVFYA